MGSCFYPFYPLHYPFTLTLLLPTTYLPSLQGFLSPQYLEEKVDKLLAVVKSGQMDNVNDKRDRSRTPKSTPTNSRQGTPTKRDSEQDIRNSLQGLGVNASGPFENGQKPIQCFKCKGWGHPRRLCPSCLNFMRGGMPREPPSPAREEMRQPPPSNPDTQQ